MFPYFNSESQNKIYQEKFRFIKFLFEHHKSWSHDVDSEPFYGISHTRRQRQQIAGSWWPEVDLNFSWGCNKTKANVNSVWLRSKLDQILHTSTRVTILTEWADHESECTGEPLNRAELKYLEILEQLEPPCIGNDYIRSNYFLNRTKWRAQT